MGGAPYIRDASKKERDAHRRRRRQLRQIRPSYGFLWCMDFPLLITSKFKNHVASSSMAPTIFCSFCIFSGEQMHAGVVVWVLIFVAITIFYSLHSILIITQTDVSVSVTINMGRREYLNSSRTTLTWKICIFVVYSQFV